MEEEVIKRNKRKRSCEAKTPIKSNRKPNAAKKAPKKSGNKGAQTQNNSLGGNRPQEKMLGGKEIGPPGS